MIICQLGRNGKEKRRKGKGGGDCIDEGINSYGCCNIVNGKVRRKGIKGVKGRGRIVEKGSLV